MPEPAKSPIPNVWPADYVPESSPFHTGNHLIDALPRIRSDNEWYAQLLGAPPFDASQRALPSHVRAYHLAGLKRLFIPTPLHVKLARQMDQVIRWGYESRRPMSPERIALLQKTFARCQASGRVEPIVFSEDHPIASFSVFGFSGMGKTTTTKRSLASYQQCIHHVIHTEEGDHHVYQVVWLRVDCPKDGSLWQLAVNILRAFDKVLGTRHAAEADKRTNADQLLGLASHLAVTHHLGVLVLDELQNLSAKKSGGRETMLNWLQELVNDLTVPVVLLGTFKARDLLDRELRHARRVCVLGSLAWDPLPFGEDFKYLMRKIWAYYWLRDPAELDDAMLEALYTETQGIRAFMIDMFLVVQLHALWKGLETITPKLIREVARREFAPVQPALNALRSHDPNRLRKFDDLMKFEVAEEIERLSHLISSAPSIDTPEPVGPQASMLARACSNVEMALGLDSTDAKQLVLRAMDASHASAQALTKAAIKLFIQLTDGKGGTPEGGAQSA